MRLKEKIDMLQNLEHNMFYSDFLLSWEKESSDLLALITAAEILQELYWQNYSLKLFDSGLAVSCFRDNSTRTRFSFASAVNALGLTVENLEESQSQIAHGETIQETANMISFLSEVIGIRDDLYLGLGDRFQRNVVKAVKNGYETRILPVRPVVINLQSDLDHPTQTLSDLLKLKNHFGNLHNMKNKKIAVTWAYSPTYGKPLSVPQGLLALLSRFGMNIHFACPPGYELLPEIEEIAARNSATGPGSFKISNSMEEAFTDADVVYPKSWAPLPVMQKRSRLWQNKDLTGLEKLEKESLSASEEFINWECNNDMMKLTKEGNALYMHCLPADISGVSCSHGEVSEEIFNKYILDTYQQAGYKPYVIMAMILLAKFKHPSAVLKRIIKEGRKRKTTV